MEATKINRRPQRERRGETQPPRFQVGGRAYAYHENSGYFMQENGAVYAILKSGRRVGEWPSLWQLLTQEIALEESKLQERTEPGL